MTQQRRIEPAAVQDIQIDLNQTDLFDPRAPIGAHYPEMMADLQGNILKGHGREYAQHLYLTFDAGRAATARRDISALAERLTSAWEQREQTKAHKKAGKSAPGPSFTSFLLTANGYRALGYNEDELPADPTFRAGMKNGITVFDDASLNDPPVDQWEPCWQEEIHGLIIVANDDVSALRKDVAEMCTGFGESVKVLHVQDGLVIRNEQDQVVEPFGFRDGISQPLFLHEDVEKARTTGGFSAMDPSAPIGLVLVKDPIGGPLGYGSYVVYRKLRQDVDGFRKRVQELADEIAKQQLNSALKSAKSAQDKAEIEANPPRPDVELAGAYVMGRFKDGTPVTLQDRPGLSGDFNNWNYNADPYGSQCPFQSHSRKMNPRGGTVPQFATSPTRDKNRRIARRAIYFRDGADKPDDPKEATRWDSTGLLFLCYQSNIANQFGFLQVRWANNEAFVRGGTGLDTIVGQGEWNAETATQDTGIDMPWPITWGVTSEVEPTGGAFKFNVAGFVRMMGGEFFFAPSLSALTSLPEPATDPGT